MNLEMFLEKKLVDRIPINASRCHQPGYIHGLQLEMEEKNESVLDLSDEEPEFFIDTVPSSMNSKMLGFPN